MKRNKRMFRLLSLLLCVCMAFSAFLPLNVMADPTETEQTAATAESGLSKNDPIDGTSYHVTSVKDYAIAPDIREQVITTNNDAGNSQTVANVMQINPNNGSAKIVAGYGHLDPSKEGWTMATTTDQAHLYENATDENVVGAINASFFNITTGEPLGCIAMRGTVYKDDPTYPYIAVFSDGSVGIFKAHTALSTAEQQQSEKQGKSVKIEEAISGYSVPVWDGEIYDPAAGSSGSGNDGYYPRSAVGLKADGTIVFLQADGTMPPRSTGYTPQEEAQILLSLGCVSALRLDEGGSSTYLSQREGEDDVSMRNVSAGGSERVVSTTILAVSTAPSTGEFDHASITPNSECYTPGSSVQLTASGMDYSGALADAIPADAVWQLAEGSEQMGELQSSPVSGNTTKAVFTSNGTLGDAQIELVSGGEVVGTAVVRIQNPDSLAFTSDEMNMNYGEQSDLGLVARYQGEPINLKDGDIVWTLPDETAGSFSGNIFTATTDKSVSVSVEITAAYGELTDTVTVNIGKQPTIIMDGGDDDQWDYSNIGNTVESFDGMDPNSVAVYHYAGRGGVVKGSVVSDTDPEYADIVRFGHNALRLDYDWTGLTGTDGACLGLGQAMEITGSPTAIGVWVYLPEGVPVPWLRAQIATSATGDSWTNAYINFTSGAADGNGLQPGWQYLEADLTQYAGQHLRLNSGMLFRAMAGNAPGFGWYTTDNVLLDKSQLKGYIILDNIQIVYGANNQDVTNPKVNDLQVIHADGTRSELENGMILTDNVLSFNATYDDNEDTDEFATGIESAYFYLDGVYYGEGSRDNLGSTLTGIAMADGSHSLTMYIKDSFGNVTRETRYFTVRGGASYTGMALQVNGAPQLGRDWSFALTSNNATDIRLAEITLNVSNSFPVKDVQFASGVTGDYSYNASRGTVTINISAVDASAVSGSTLATVVVSIPAASASGASVGVQVTAASYEVAASPELPEGSQDFWGGFSTQLSMYAPEAYYTLQAPAFVVGMDAAITATKDGKAVEGLNIYNGDGSLLGTTDQMGQVDASALAAQAGSYVVYAQDANGNLSYRLTVNTYNAAGPENGDPYYVICNATDDASTKKNISWMSNPIASTSAAQVRYSVSEDMSGALTAAADSSIVSYSGSMVANRANSVILTGLTPNTTYYYQVGDGAHWSAVKQFTTAQVDEDQTDMYILADIQEEDALVGFGNIAKLLQQKDYDLGIQTGDAVDNVRYYNQWENALDLFTLDGVAQSDVLHVIGNHEADDDGYGGAAAKQIFNIDADWYSVEYGDVYIAVLNHTSQKDKLEAFGQWLVEDAAKSDCPWKIVTTHVPPYYTNPTGGGETYNEVLPAALEQAGIDMVFAGNDHSYARTAPLTAGAVDQENGVVYYICGSTGGKSYSIVNNPDFHFDIATLDFTSVYMSVSATPSQITVTAYNVDANGNETVLDTYSKEKTPCTNDEHTYVYDRDKDRLECTVCGQRVTAKEDQYSGWATDAATGKSMYFAGGTVQTGEIKMSDGTICYFDTNGLALDGSVTICGETCTFENGAFTGSSNADVRFAGTIGTNVQWVLYDDGLLKVDGSGDMKDYHIRGGAPWSEYRNDIKAIEIGKNITSIGSYDFYGAVNCKSVTFEEGSQITDIGGSAFYYFSNLKEITLPDTVTTIGNYAFGYSGKLKSVYLPDGVTFINDTAFNSCSASLVLSVAADSYAESYAKSKGIAYEVRVEPEKPLYSGTCGENIEWALYEDGSLKLTGFGPMTSYSGNRQGVPWYNYRNDITSIWIDKDITSIGVYAFYGAINCESVVFEEGSQVTDIGGSAFYYFSSLKEITLPDSVTTIGNYAFGYGGKLEKVYLPDGVASINDTAFNSCSGKLTLNVARGTYAEEYAQKRSIAYDVREPQKDPLYSGACGENVEWALYDDGLLKLTGFGAMDSYSGNRQGVPWYNYRNDITAIWIDKDITSIGVYAFYGAINCESVVFEEGSQLTDIGGSAFYYFSSLKEIVLPQTVTTIGNYAFGYGRSLESVYLPDGVVSINDTAFNACNSNLTLQVAQGSYAEEYAKNKGLAYETRKPAEKPVDSGTCGANVEWALYGDGLLKLTGSGPMDSYSGNRQGAPWYNYRNNITAIWIDKDITTIGVYAFYGAINCESVTFEEGSKVNDIGGSAFYYFSSLKEITLPTYVSTIGNYAFGYGGKLEKVYLPAGVDAINDTAFNACSDKLVLSVAEGSYAESYAQSKGLAYEVRS